MAHNVPSIADIALSVGRSALYVDILSTIEQIDTASALDSILRYSLYVIEIRSNRVAIECTDRATLEALAAIFSTCYATAILDTRSALIVSMH